MKPDVKHDLAWGAIILGVAVAATCADKLGYIEGDAVLRLCQGACGLYMLSLANLIPKAVAPDALTRQVARFGGWSMAIGSLVYIALWVFAPIQAAGILGWVAVLAGIATPVGYAVWLKAKAKAAM
jgi:hypothetical protein